MLYKMRAFVRIVTMTMVLVSMNFIEIQAKPQQLKPGCRYEGRRYQEGAPVSTAEPCLQCRCVEGSLRCRLRVCPRLPQPIPRGCRVRPPAENVCCSELVCGVDDEDENENILQRSNTAASHHPRSEEGQAEFSTTLAAISGNGCRSGDHVYQEGEMVRDIAWKAACDNCFCAMGAIRCVPLACAPPLQGCKPIVREGQCCPSTYNCSGTIEVKATQNYASYAFISKDYAKFRKETNFYPAIHDAGLTSVEGRGHRDVNEALEAVDTRNIGEKFAMVTESIPSHETETMNNEILTETTDYPRHTTRDQEQLTVATTEFSPSTDTTSLDLSTTTTTSQDEEETADSSAYLGEVETTTATATTMLEDTSTESVPVENNEFVTANVLPVTTTAEITETSEFISVTSASSKTSAVPTTTRTRGQDPKSTSSPKIDLKSTSSSSINLNATVSSTTKTSPSPINIIKAETTSQSSLEKIGMNRTLTTTTTATTTTKKSTSDVNKIKEKTKADNKGLGSDDKISVIGVKKPSMGLSTSIIVPDDMFVMNVTVKTNVAVGHIHGVTINPIGKPIPPDIEAILNITNRRKGEDYEYDYSEPTLPPSLPNVRIIPFVAADALVKNKDVVDDDVLVASSVTGYPTSAVVVPPELGPKETNYYDIVTQENRFTPPEKTEGGFVPREPPYFDPLFHSPDLNLEIGTRVTVAPDIIPVPNPHRKNNEIPRNCLYEEREYGHGQVLPSRALCVTCVCYYGEIICSNQKCPPLKIGCQRINDPTDKCCSKIVCVNGVESPTVVLDRLDSTSSSQHEPTVSPDPFRDVIKTEPAPDLPSLIGDMMIPYFVEHGITTPTAGNALASSQTNFLVPSHNDSRNVDATKRVKPPSVPENSDRNLVSQHNAGNFSADDVTLTDLDVDPIIRDVDGSTPAAFHQFDADDSIFSLDRVLDLFFSVPASVNETTTTPRTRENSSTTTKKSSVDTAADESLPSSNSSAPRTVTTTRNSSTSSTTKTTATTTTTTTTASTTTFIPATGDSSTRKTLVEKDSSLGASGGLLKLAGCNIYGRMYSVGRIITELSNHCRECRCTEVGVQCKSLDC